ncbi:MAG: phosphate-starvation-inducible PsiE family protein [Methanolinea sp.]|nr:phosphate-starvation-inducible PsiE family protein [Methanolinea sp.]
MVERSYHRIHDIFRRMLENVQDVIVIVICILLFALMLKILFGLFESFSGPLDFQYIASELIYILVLVEIYRLLIIYLREHRIAVDIMIEVGIVSILREIILHGVLEINPMTLGAISLLLVALMLLLRYGSIRKEEVERDLRDGFFTELKKSIRREKSE